MDDVENKSFEVKVKKEPEEDESCDEIIHENVSADSIKQECKQDVSADSIKQECKQEVDWECSNDDYLIYDENLGTYPKLEVNFTIPEDGRIYQCPKCPVRTKYASNLTKHISSMHPGNKHVVDNPYWSSIANLQNTTGHSTNNSLQIAQNKKNLFQSKKLDNGITYGADKFLNKQALIKRKYAFSCSHCSFNCNYKYDLIHHVYQLHFDHSSAQTVCSRCGKYVHSNLKSHLAYCIRKESVQCDYCLNYYTGKYHLQEHIFKMHFEDGTFQKNKQKQYMYALPACPECGKRYKHWQTLSNHMAYCGKKIKKRPFQCETCSHETTNRYSLAAHILRRHLKKNNLCQNISYI